MREAEDAPPIDCPTCGTPNAAVFGADARCGGCGIDLAEAARAACAAIEAVGAAIAAEPALPQRLRAGLKARLFEADRLLIAALAAGERIAAPALADRPAPDPEPERAPAPDTAAEAAIMLPGAAEVEAPEALEPAAPAALDPAAPAALEAAEPPTVAEPEPAALEAPAAPESAATLDPPEPIAPLAAAVAAPTPPARPSLWQRLGPAFAEHLMFFLGGFLLLAGAVYFVSTAWTTMTGSAQLFVIEGAILLFGAGLVGAGRLLNRDRTLDDLDAVLATAGAACVPLAGLAVGRQALGGLLPGLGGIALWGLAGVAITRWGLSRVGIADRRITGGLQLAALGAIVGPLLGGWPVLTAALPIGVGAWAAARRDHWPIHAVAFIAAAATAGQVAIHTGAWGVLALPLVASAVVFSRHRALSHADDLIAVGLAIGAFALGLLTPNAALLVAAAGCVIAARAALNRARNGLLIAAFVLGLAAYVLLPAPIKGIVLALKARAAEGLGYAGGRLPLAWYGVTCLPYVFLCGWAARRLVGSPLARTARLWTLGIAAALCLLAFSTPDLRAPLLVLPLEGLLLLGLAFWIPSMRMAQAAPVLIAAFPILATPHFDLPLSTIPLGIALVALALRGLLPRRGAMVHGVYQSCACLLAGAAGLAVVPAVWAGAAVHWLDLLTGPALVLAIWPVAPLRPLALLALHRMIPALAALTGLPVWPAAGIVALAATLALGAWRRDRHPALIGWALLAVALLGGGYAPPVGLDATIGLIGAAALGIALAWGTGHSPLAAVGLSAFALGVASVAWVLELRPSRVGASAAVAFSLGVIALGWLHRRHPAIYARIGRAPSVVGLIAAVLAAGLYVGGDALGLLKKPALIAVGIGLLAAMAAAPRTSRLTTPWTGVGIAAIWLASRGAIGVLPWAVPGAAAAVLAAALVRAGLRFAPGALPVAALFGHAWKGFLFLALVQTAAGPAVTPLDALPLVALLALTGVRKAAVTDGLAVAALALLLVGPIMAPLVSLEWAPVALLLLGAAGARMQRLRWVPRGFEALVGVAAVIWLVAFGPALVGAVLDARVQAGPLAMGCGWIALGVAGLAVFEREAPIRLLVAAPLLWWAPVAGLLADGPARAAPALAALALGACLFAKRRPRLLWTQLAFAALLTTGLWSHPLTPLTAGLITTAIALAAWRWGQATETEATPWLVAGAGVVGVLWATPTGPTPWGQLGLALAAGGLLAAATRRHGGTTWALAAGGLLAGLGALTGLGAGAAGLATAALVLRAWRTRDPAAREGAAVFGAIAAVVLALALGGGVTHAALAALGAITVAAALKCSGITVGLLAGLASCFTLVGAPAWAPLAGGAVLAGVPWIVWWRRRHPFALEGAMYGLAAATVLALCWHHGAAFVEAVGHDAAWTVAAVALLAAGLRRSPVTVFALAAVALGLHGLDPLGVRHLASATLVAAALARLGQTTRISAELAFGPLAWAAILAVRLGLDGSPAEVDPWAAAAVGGVALGAAFARRHGVTLGLLTLAATLFSEVATVHPGTALAGVACAAAFAVCVWRGGGAADRLVAWCMAPVGLTAALGWALQLPADVPLLAWAAATAALTSAIAARRGAGWPDRLAAALLGGVTCALLLTVATAGIPIGGAGIALVGAVAALVHGWSARLGQRPRAVHALLGLVAALHFALARATPWLDGLAGHHLEVWSVIAVLLAVVQGFLPKRVGEELRAWYLVLPILALLGAHDAAAVARIAFVGAVTWGLASRGGPRWLRFAAFGLANLGAWAFWLGLDLVDPTLYGLPPGITLLALAEVERGRLSVKGHLALLATGFALAYGGMAVQIVTGGGALHAVLLLAGGLASVAVGWRLRRVDLLVGGTAAVILDVACYLLRHGFQQSFVSAGLLLFAGATVLLAATVAARMRRAA